MRYPAIERINVVFLDLLTICHSQGPHDYGFPAGGYTKSKKMNPVCVLIDVQMIV